MNRTIRRIAIALSLVPALGFAQVPVDEYLKARKSYGISLPASAQELKGFVGTKVVEVRVLVKGVITSRTDTVMTEAQDGLKLNITCDPAPEYLKKSQTLVRLLVRVSRKSEISDLTSELVMIGDDAALEPIDARTRASLEKVSAPRSTGSTTSRSGTRFRNDVAPSQTPSLSGPIGSVRDQVVRSNDSGIVVNPPVPTNTQPDVSAPAVPASMQEVVRAYTGYILSVNRKLDPATAQQWASYIIRFANESNLDARLMLALIKTESDFRPNLTSHKGAMGLAQLMPDEARRFGLSSAYDPAQNIQTSCKLLSEGIAKYRAKGYNEWDSIVLALAGYNAGHGAVRKFKYQIPPYRETQGYVRKITTLYKQFIGMN